METQMVERIRVRVEYEGYDSVLAEVIVVNDDHYAVLADDADECDFFFFNGTSMAIHDAYIHPDDVPLLRAKVDAGWVPDPPWPETPTPQPDADTNQETSDD